MRDVGHETDEPDHEAFKALAENSTLNDYRCSDW